MKLFGGLLNAICFQSFSTIHKQHLGLFSNFDHAKSGGKQGTLLTKVLMHLLCFKVIISRAFIPAVTMHVEPVCSEMCILQAESFLIQIRPHLQQVMNHSKRWSHAVTNQMWLFPKLRFKQKKIGSMDRWLHKEVGLYTK